MNRIVGMAVLWFAAMGVPCRAQQPDRSAVLTGRVLEAGSDVGIPLARVEVQSPRDTTFTLTDADGSFTVRGPQGWVVVQASQRTYFTYRRGRDLSKRKEPLIIKLKHDWSTMQEVSP